MAQTSIELQVSRDMSRKQVTEDYARPVGVPTAATTDASDAERPVQTKKQALDARFQFAACCVPLFLAGWNDAALGPLLPRIQSVYHVGFSVVSLLFVLACLGFITGALVNVPLSDKLGFGKVMVIGSLFEVVAYSLMVPALPFPVLAIAYFINGIGIAMQESLPRSGCSGASDHDFQDAQASGYVAALERNAEAKMGLLHAVYGAGALCSPLVATQFAQLTRWSFQYLVSLGLSIVNTLILITVFRFKTQDECLQQIGQRVPERTSNSQDRSTLRQILSHKTVHSLAFFIFVYLGVGVTIGGWIVTYIIRERHGGPSSGYISAGFFGGVMIGRVALLWVNKKIGERLAIFVYAFLAIGLELIVWLVPSLIGDAVAVSIVGVLLGPMYPIVMNHAGRVLPRWILTGSIGWIAGFGTAGGALVPFMTGAISSKFGIRSLQPLLVSMMGLMIVMWAIVPKGPRRAD
ncbi:putative MFS general substrate transporter [Lyophyllum shimeji]|uniref:MFS general substrate transporter n=1 Tax=Lyophyllum shimeji TaxID=47721 RepID=A0A9P3Q1S2_LYOSH|nr:putative MFS general substrate transporter [Lyophyllum shimeji]